MKTIFFFAFQVAKFMLISLKINKQIIDTMCSYRKYPYSVGGVKILSGTTQLKIVLILIIPESGIIKVNIHNRGLVKH